MAILENQLVTINEPAIKRDLDFKMETPSKRSCGKLQEC